MSTTSVPSRARRGLRLRAAASLLLLPLALTACGGDKTENAAATSAASPSATASSATTTTTSATTTTAPSPSATTTACAFDGARTAPADTTLARMTVTGARVGQQQCFDRLVIDLTGDASRKPGYNVRYVPQVLQEGSGKPVVLRGTAFLSVTVGAANYDASGQATYIPADRNEVGDVTGFPSFRQVAMAGSYEGMTTLGVGVREELPFKVSLLDDGGGKMRLVVDVAHAAS